VISEDPFIRELDDSHAGHMLAMAICSAYITNIKFGLTVMVSSQCYEDICHENYTS